MTDITIQLQFDEKELGPGWMNEYNLMLLLYESHKTKKELLQVVSYKDEIRSEG